MRELKPTKFIPRIPYKFGFGLYNDNISIIQQWSEYKEIINRPDFSKR